MNTKARGPICWFGGKGNMTKRLLPLLPKCHTYVEVFGGGAALLFAREPSPVEVYNDVDQGLVDFFRVLADPTLFRRFRRRVKYLPLSRALYCECRDTWQAQTDIVERVWRWFVVARQSFGGRFGESWGFARTSSACGMAKQSSSWINTLKELPRFHARVQRVQIENLDWRKCLDYYDTPDTLFYVDPPYVPETRKSGEYNHELTADDHCELAEKLLSLKGMVALSGYANPIYKKLEANGWERRDFGTSCHAAGRTRATGILGRGSALIMQPRVDSLYRNPACIQAKNKDGGILYLPFE